MRLAIAIVAAAGLLSTSCVPIIVADAMSRSADRVQDAEIADAQEAILLGGNHTPLSADDRAAIAEQLFDELALEPEPCTPLAPAADFCGVGRVNIKRDRARKPPQTAFVQTAMVRLRGYQAFQVRPGVDLTGEGSFVVDGRQLVRVTSWRKDGRHVALDFVEPTTATTAREAR